MEAAQPCGLLDCPIEIVHLICRQVWNRRPSPSERPDSEEFTLREACALSVERHAVTSLAQTCRQLQIYVQPWLFGELRAVEEVPRTVTCFLLTSIERKDLARETRAVALSGAITNRGFGKAVWQKAVSHLGVDFSPLWIKGLAAPLHSARLFDAVAALVISYLPGLEELVLYWPGRHYDGILPKVLSIHKEIAGGGHLRSLVCRLMGQRSTSAAGSDFVASRNDAFTLVSLLSLMRLPGLQNFDVKGVTDEFIDGEALTELPITTTSTKPIPDIRRLTFTGCTLNARSLQPLFEVFTGLEILVMEHSTIDEEDRLDLPALIECRRHSLHTLCVWGSNVHEVYLPLADHRTLQNFTALRFLSLEEDILARYGGRSWNLPDADVDLLALICPPSLQVLIITTSVGSLRLLPTLEDLARRGRRSSPNLQRIGAFLGFDDEFDLDIGYRIKSLVDLFKSWGVDYINERGFIHWPPF